MTETAQNNPVVEIQKPVPLRPDRLTELGWLSCVVSVSIPLVGITVRDILDLRIGSILGSAFHRTAELPFACNGKPIAKAEFEVVGNRLAARLTEIE